MKINLKNFLTFFLIIIFFSDSDAQDTTLSLAFKKNQPKRRTSFFYQPDLSYQIWKQFNLVKEANAGNPLAQHELGIRYLIGEDVPADTLLGAYWVKKAAEQKLTSASFNYGILLLNGWGVEWDPFNAFKYFDLAAKDGMSQAQYIVGLFYTDNLIVKRNWSEAYRWIKKSADADYEPAKKVLKELVEKVPPAQLDTSNIKDKNEKYSSGNDDSLPTSLGLVFIDFDTPQDTIKEITDKMLLENLLLLENEKLKTTLSDSAAGELKITTINNDSLDIPLITKIADTGSPEALTILGRLYEKGIHFEQDENSAAAFYIRASRNESPVSRFLLWKMNLDSDYYSSLKKLIDNNDSEAMFIWYGLNSLGFDKSITEQDAFNLLNNSASLKYLPALTELGLVYYTGGIIQQDKDKAFSIWQMAKELGSIEAEARLMAIKIFDKNEFTGENFLRLQELVDAGSLFAQFLLAYCYENGVTINQDKAEAVKYFRLAAQRGSRFAYEELKRIFDEVRPDEPGFIIN